MVAYLFFRSGLQTVEQILGKDVQTTSVLPAATHNRTSRTHRNAIVLNLLDQLLRMRFILTFQAHIGCIIQPITLT